MNSITAGLLKSCSGVGIPSNTKIFVTGTDYAGHEIPRGSYLIVCNNVTISQIKRFIEGSGITGEFDDVSGNRIIIKKQNEPIRVVRNYANAIKDISDKYKPDPKPRNAKEYIAQKKAKSAKQRHVNRPKKMY